jgi:hypothetical protein
MIRAIANKRLDISNDEHSYFKTIKEEIGIDSFRGLFATDDNGIITAITPPTDKSTPMVVLFFVLNIMMNQRLRVLDRKITSNNFEDRLSALESKVKEL